MNRNYLNKSNYLISKELHEALESELPLSKSGECVDKNPGIYLLAIRFFNKDSNSFSYSYIYYPSIFLETFMTFLVTKNDFSIRYKEWGDNLVLVNKDVFLGKSEWLDMVNTNPFLLNDSTNLKLIYDSLGSYYVASDVLDILRITTRLNVITKNYDEMFNVFNMAQSKNYPEFVKLILPDWYPYFEGKFTGPINIDYSILNTLLFVVRDFNQFTNTISNKGFTITGGSKKWRGQISSTSGLLSTMDMDYRNSLCNHNHFHVRNGLIDNKFLLPKDKFSFRNVHMNLGNIKWYSTKRTVNRETMARKLLDRVKSQNSFKSESIIYLYLSNYLRNSPINEKTQRNIENYLLNFYTESLTNKQKESTLFKYDLFSNPKVKQYIIDTMKILQEHLNNQRSKSLSLKSNVRHTAKYKASYYLNVILNELNDNLVIEKSLGILARIVSNFNLFTEDTTSIRLTTELGESLIGSYFYCLYKKFIVDNIKAFMIDLNKHIESNNISELDKKNLLKDISIIEKNYNKQEVYELKILIKNILKLNCLSDTNFENIKLILSYTLSDWKLDNNEHVNLFNESIRFEIASIILEWLKDSDLIRIYLQYEKKDKKLKQQSYYVPTESLSNLLETQNNRDMNYIPLRIPMIVKPKLYSRELIDGVIKERLGGYLINDEKVTDSIIIPNFELKRPSIIKDQNPNLVYNLVNNMNSVTFKINREMLDFIYLNGDLLGLLKNDFDNSIELSGITKTKYTELESNIAKLELQNNILGLAELCSLVPEFYLPVRLDFRGRVNCVSQYLNYQSNELAKSVLLFSKGEKLMKNDIEGISYFKAYGANCFGNKLDKKSWIERRKWVDENHLDIINYSNGKLIKKAENKLLFTAFCMEYSKWFNSYNNLETSYFESHLPIQLDATCNGYQHLSMLINDYDMAKELNLTQSTVDQDPKDYYAFTVLKLADLFKTKIELNNISEEIKECYKRLANLLIGRKAVKKAIMTIPYNVSVINMIKYLKEHFIDLRPDERKSTSSFILQYQYKEDPSVLLCEKDLSLIASSLREVLERTFPKLKLLTIYLKIIAKILNNLNLYIPWGTASGLEVDQSYTTSREIKLKPFSYDKNSFTLKVSTGTLSGNKQIRALMPNLIHSLDAASLALLAEDLFNNTQHNNFYAIHDCFAVTANNVPLLIKSLQATYMKIYTEESYLKEFDAEIIRHITYHYGKDCYDPKTNKITVIINNKKIVEKYPDINCVLGTELPNLEIIKDSCYIAN